MELMRNTTEDYIGQKFNRLTVISEISNDNQKKVLCRCECGNEKTILLNDLRRGHTKSCGCLHKETFSKITTTHGLSKTSEFNIWQLMKARCYNPNNHKYLDYGGRGIQVCDRWLNSFEAFYEDMGPRPSEQHSIDRKDNNGHYELGNCRWATAKQQANNRRSNHLIKHNGESKTIAKIAEENNINYQTLFSRLNKIESIDDAININMEVRNA